MTKELFCTTWASSQYLTEEFNMPPVELSFNTLRQIVHTSIGGEKIRLKFSNRVGNSELTIKKVCISISDGQGTAKIISETTSTVKFNKKNDITIKAGEEAYSDVINFTFSPLAELAVTIHFGKVPEKVTGHPGSRTFSYIEKGDKTEKKNFSVSTKTAHWYFLSAIEVYSEKDNNAIVCFGDSITDGRGSTDDLQNRWTDKLSEKIQKDFTVPHNLAVINQGIGGTCLLTNGMERFERDVLSVPKIKYIILLYGINDIIYLKAKTTSIIKAYKTIIKKAHKKNIKVYGGTLLPFGNCADFSDENEKKRKKINLWIRKKSGKHGGFDSFIDFDKFLKDPPNPQKLNNDFDCSDGLHPSAEGYAQMSKAFTDLSIFCK